MRPVLLGRAAGKDARGACSASDAALGRGQLLHRAPGRAPSGTNGAGRPPPPPRSARPHGIRPARNTRCARSLNAATVEGEERRNAVALDREAHPCGQELVPEALARQIRPQAEADPGGIVARVEGEEPDQVLGVDGEVLRPPARGVQETRRGPPRRHRRWRRRTRRRSATPPPPGRPRLSSPGSESALPNSLTRNRRVALFLEAMDRETAAATASTWRSTPATSMRAWPGWCPTWTGRTPGRAATSRATTRSVAYWTRGQWEQVDSTRGAARGQRTAGRRRRGARAPARSQPCRRGPLRRRGAARLHVPRRPRRADVGRAVGAHQHARARRPRPRRARSGRRARRPRGGRCACRRPAGPARHRPVLVDEVLLDQLAGQAGAPEHLEPPPPCSRSARRRRGRRRPAAASEPVHFMSSGAEGARGRAWGSVDALGERVAGAPGPGSPPPATSAARTASPAWTGAPRRRPAPAAAGRTT